MIYYIYFDRYRNPKKAISEAELTETYQNNPDDFLKAMESLDEDRNPEKALGHVGILRFESEKELRDFLETTGEEIIGFYECHSESRPYNF